MQPGIGSVVLATGRLTLVECPRWHAGFRFQAISDDLRRVLNSLCPGPVKALERFQYIGSRALIYPQVSVEIKPLSAPLDQPFSNRDQLVRLRLRCSPNIRSEEHTS